MGCPRVGKPTCGVKLSKQQNCRGTRNKDRVHRSEAFILAFMNEIVAERWGMEPPWTVFCRNDRG